MMSSAYLRASSLVIVGLMLVSCGDHSRAGAGALPPDNGWRTNYQSYLNRGYPMVFAMSADGRASYSIYCPDINCRSPTGAIEEALSKCDANSRTRCYLYDLNGKVVWDEKGQAKPSTK